MAPRILLLLSSSHFLSSFSLGERGASFSCRGPTPASQGQERGEKENPLARLLGLAPKAMSESCGIFFFRRRHFSFAVKEEGKKDTLSPLSTFLLLPSFSLGFRGGLWRWRRRRTMEYPYPPVYSIRSIVSALFSH